MTLFYVHSRILYIHYCRIILGLKYLKTELTEICTEGSRTGPVWITKNMFIEIRTVFLSSLLKPNSRLPTPKFRSSIVSVSAEGPAP